MYIFDDGKSVLTIFIELRVYDLGENGNSSCKGENKPTITLHSPMRFALIGSTVVLPCRATGKLRPYTYWLDNNAAVIHSSSNPRHKILRNGDLVIDPLEWTDMGSLTCYAKSDYKEDSVTTFLYPMVVSRCFLYIYFLLFFS